MKKATVIVGLVFLFAAFALPAETPTIYEAESAHYRVFSEISEKDSQDTAKTLDALFNFYNSFFHFESAALKTKLKVRILTGKKRYDEYLTRVLGQTREDFIYLHYADQEKCELVAYAADAPAFQESLNHQAMIQFIRAFIPQPPLWMREGFAIFFEKTTYDPSTAQAVYKENLAWLDTLKGLQEKGGNGGLLGLKEMLGMTVEKAKEKINVFYPQAWGMASFLVNAPDKEYNRILWDSLSALKAEADLEQNVGAVYQKSFKWYDEARLSGDFLQYLAARKSFRTLVQEGIDHYSKNELDRSEESFIGASEIEEDSYIPYYYLGLVNYGRKNYSVAEHYYKQALECGAQPSLVYYALGVNSFAGNRLEDAQTYLKMTKEADAAYKDKADELLKRLGK